LPTNAKGKLRECEKPQLEPHEQCRQLTVTISEKNISKIENVLSDCTSEKMELLLTTVLRRSNFIGSYCKIYGVVKSQKLCAIEEWDLKESHKYAEKEKELREKKRVREKSRRDRKKQELLQDGGKKKHKTSKKN